MPTIVAIPDLGSQFVLPVYDPVENKTEAEYDILRQRLVVTMPVTMMILRGKKISTAEVMDFINTTVSGCVRPSDVYFKLAHVFRMLEEGELFNEDTAA